MQAYECLLFNPFRVVDPVFQFKTNLRKTKNTYSKL